MGIAVALPDVVTAVKWRRRLGDRGGGVALMALAATTSRTNYEKCSKIREWAYRARHRLEANEGMSADALAGNKQASPPPTAALKIK